MAWQGHDVRRFDVIATLAITSARYCKIGDLTVREPQSCAS
jgi:hypothetical protein